MSDKHDWQALSVELAMNAKKNLDAKDDEITRLRSEVERLRGRCAELKSALMPFAAEAEYVPDYAVDMHLNYIMDDAEVLERASFTAEDIHTAAQRLRQQAAEIEGGDDDKP